MKLISNKLYEQYTKTVIGFHQYIPNITKEQLQQKEDIINKAKEYVKDYKTEWTLNDEVLDDMDELLEILDNKGE